MARPAWRLASGTASRIRNSQHPVLLFWRAEEPGSNHRTEKSREKPSGMTALVVARAAAASALTFYCLHTKQKQAPQNLRPGSKDVECPMWREMLIELPVTSSFTMVEIAPAAERVLLHR